ncbi:OLC1v1000746C1 [Oldenlandia corymbosa var. corymbosa]|uniref:OLC1v1000746C1 n=1 Tax=Oldenlandia corymbosa var. corymbosa TaxID=529605 RepID=A0AAV1D6M3_OLDCO|nr:OLC1v1000746C1 [Oldenlandia corymbosa var. corymbosa]
MSQEQPSRPQAADEEQELQEQQAVKPSDDNVASKTAVLSHLSQNIGGGQDAQKTQRNPLQSGASELKGSITIGEALEATVLTAGHRAVDYSDAAAIQAAEVRATGRTNIVPGGVAAAAQSAATRNARATREEDKTKLAEVLLEASSKLPADKPVTRRDAEGVIGAELRNDPNLCTRPGGVAASLAAAARLNQTMMNQKNEKS